MCFTSNNIITVLIISLWTIVQTSFHIIWCLCGYYSYVCKIQPNNYWLVIVYLTYFYNDECGEITVGGDLFTVKKQKKSDVSLDNVGDEDTVYSIIHTIVKNATLPLEASEAYRTALYLVIYIFLDGFWIITSLLLLAGACFQIKKCLSVLFYGPWILITGVSIILDTVSSVHFGLDLLQINSYTSWIKFIGVSNYEDFTKFDGYNSSGYVSRGSAILMCSLFSRLLFFWVMNITGLFRVTNIAILAFREDDAPDANSNNRRGHKTNRRSTRLHAGETSDSADARIRNWQLFYGAVGTMTTSSSSSSQSSDDVFYNSRGIAARTPSITPVAQSSQNQEDRPEIDHISPIQEFSEIVNNVSSHYMKFSDVAEDINLRKASIESLQSQLPWTYIKSSEVQGPLGIGGGSSSSSSVQRMKNDKRRFTGIDGSDRTVSSTAL